MSRTRMAIALGLFIAVMVALKLWVVPEFVAAFGLAGVAALFLVVLAWAHWQERRDRRDSVGG